MKDLRIELIIALAIFVYLLIISLIACILTVSDKKRAQENRWRISENTLLFVGLMGGAAAELAVMKKIHHKTKKPKFTIGLPLEIFLHIVIIILIISKAAV